MLRKPVTMDGCRCLYGLLQRLPASHPALLFTSGSVRSTHTSTSGLQCSMSTTASKFHHRSFHNIQHTLPSFRRPAGISLYEYVSVTDIGSVNQHVGKDNKSFLGHSKTTKSVMQAPLRLIHSQKQEQAKQRTFLLSPQSIVAASPTAVQPYLRLVRLDRPIGTWLLFLPCAFSLSLSAAPGCLPDPYMIALFGLGSVLMRGAGCTINDMWDKDFDAKVARTKDRPLACGEINFFQALVFLGAQLSGALAILLTFNWYTIGLGVSSLALCVTYPLMKRFTYWPQVFLGLTFNYGVMMGWSAAAGQCSWPAVLPLYTACLTWTLVYDTIYAHQDKADDILVGVKSTALRLGDDTKKWLTGFTGVLTAALATTGVMCDQTWPYYVGVALFTGHLGRQIYTVDLDNPDDCGAKFRSNRNLGIAFWLAIMAGNLLKEDKKEEGEEEEEAKGLA